MSNEMTLLDFWPYLVLHYLPVVVFFAGAATYAILKWRRHPRLSMLVLSALLLATISNALWLLFGLGSGPKGRLISDLAINLYSLSGIVFWGLLIFAAFFGFHEGRRSAGCEANSHAPVHPASGISKE